MKKLILYPLILWAMGMLLCANPVYIPHPSVKFSEESLHFELTKDEWKVRGIYTFVNQNEIGGSESIFYPISDFVWNGNVNRNDNLLPINTKISFKQIEPVVSELESWEADYGHVIRFHIESYETVVVEISYTLPIPDKPDAAAEKYISLSQDKILRKISMPSYYVKTAKKWGNRLLKANFVLSVDEGIKVNATSFPDPVITTQNGKKLYTWEYFDWSPDLDFLVDYELE